MTMQQYLHRLLFVNNTFDISSFLLALMLRNVTYSYARICNRDVRQKMCYERPSMIIEFTEKLRL